MSDVASEIVGSRAEALNGTLRDRGFKAVARVAEATTTDFAIPFHAMRCAVVRYADQTTTDDHAALATMMAEGDFVWAGLVYGEREGSETVGLIEAFHVSELDRLVSRLLELREVFGEPG